MIAHALGLAAEVTAEAITLLPTPKDGAAEREFDRFGYGAGAMRASAIVRCDQCGRVRGFLVDAPNTVLTLPHILDGWSIAWRTPLESLAVLCPACKELG